MSTSELQRYTAQLIERLLNDVDVLENTRPDWLINDDGARLELDFYIPRFDVAIEVQGDQHYEFTPFFHGDTEGYRKQIERDKRKRAICESRGITLLEVIDRTDALSCIEAVCSLSHNISDIDLPSAEEQVSNQKRRAEERAFIAERKRELSSIRDEQIEERKIERAKRADARRIRLQERIDRVQREREMSSQNPLIYESKPRQWDLEERGNSGVFAVSRAGALLFRVELAIGMLYLWDKKASREIPVRLCDLMQSELTQNQGEPHEPRKLAG